MQGVFNLFQRALFGGALAFAGAASAPAAIIIDGTDYGSSYTLTSSASTILLSAAGDILTLNANINGGLSIQAVTNSTVYFGMGNIRGGLDFSGGDLTVTGNANIQGGASIAGGNVLFSGGNISGGLDILGGIVTLDAAGPNGNLNINGSVDVSGGGLFVDDVSNFNSRLRFSGNAVGWFGGEAANVNSRLSVDDEAAVYFSAPRVSSTGTDADGRVLGDRGTITGLGNNIRFDSTSDRTLFLGADRSDAEDAIAAITPAAVPEPGRAFTALFGIIAALLQRRRRPI